MFVLPQDSLVHLFYYLTKQELLRINTTCKAFAHAILNVSHLFGTIRLSNLNKCQYDYYMQHASFEKFVRNLYLQNCTLFASDICSKYAQHVHYLQVTYTEDLFTVLNNLQVNFDKVEHLRVELCAMTSEFFEQLKQFVLGKCNKLQVLELDDGTMGNAGQNERLALFLNKIHARVQQIRLNCIDAKSYEPWSELLDEPKYFANKLVSLQIEFSNATLLAHILTSCSNLMVLEMYKQYGPAFTSVQTSNLAKALQNMKQLLKLEIQAFEFNQKEDKQLFFENLPTSITELEVGRMEFYCTFPAVRHLKHLRMLHLFNLYTVSVPTWIGEMEQLKDLRISVNNATNLMRFWYKGQLPPLKQMFVNKMDDPFEASMYEHTRIQTLEIENSTTSSPISREFVDKVSPTMKSLSLFYIKGLCISTESHLEKLEMLESIYMREIQIESLANLSSLNHLYEVSLPNCKLQTFPEELGTAPNLSILHLENNSIKAIPIMLTTGTSFPNLESLYMTNNQVQQIPNFSKHKRLRIINFRANPFIAKSTADDTQILELLDTVILDTVRNAVAGQFHADYSLECKLTGCITIKKCTIEYVIAVNYKGHIAIGTWVDAESTNSIYYILTLTSELKLVHCFLDPTL